MIKKLPKAPLQEVIFEVRWDLDLDPETQRLQDNGFDLAVGKFANAIEGQFSFPLKKVPGDIPIDFFNHQPVHQFWTNEQTWPVVQLGPGIMTFNDTDKNYEWENNFFPTLKTLLEQLCKAYSKSKELNFTDYTLRYIDVVKIADYSFENWPAFIQSSLNFSFENLFETSGRLKDFNFQQTFEQPGLGGLTIVIANGKNKKREEVLIWQIAITQNKKADLDALLVWVKNAHEVTSKVFLDICKKEFYASFTN